MYIKCKMLYEQLKQISWILNQETRLPYFHREHPYNISLLVRDNIENRLAVKYIETLFYRMKWNKSIRKHQ